MNQGRRKFLPDQVPNLYRAENQVFIKKHANKKFCWKQDYDSNDTDNIYNLFINITP